MLKKISVISLLCLVALAQAIPHHDHGEKSSEEETNGHHGHHGGHHGAHQGHGNHGGGGGGRHHDYHGEHNLYGLNPNSPFIKVKNLTSQLYTEFFVLATGDNYLSPEVANEVHVAARAAVLLSQKLRHVQHLYQLLSNVTTDFALKGSKVEDKQVMTDLVNEVVSQLKNTPDFTTIKSTLDESFISRQKYFKKDATAEQKDKVVKDDWLREPFMKLASLNRIFYLSLQRGDPHGKMFSALEEHSYLEECSEKLEKIYSSALAKTVEDICPAHEEKKAKERFLKVVYELLSEDAVLSVKLYGTQKLMLTNTPF